MRRSKRQPTSKSNAEPKLNKVHSDEDDEETSDNDSGSDTTGDNKYRRNQCRRIQSEDDYEPDSDDEASLAKTRKLSKNGKRLEVKAIISRRQLKGKTKYLLKWKDGSETWETKRKTERFCPAILCQYIEDFNEQTRKSLEVEAIISHEKKKQRIKYLIKWKDHSKGETWETECRAKQVCPELLAVYVQEIQMAEQKAVEVEAIVGHKIEYHRHKYLIKWKDHSKGETWETTRKTMSLCPDILDEFTKDKPELAPPSSYFETASPWYKETKEKPEKRKYLFGRVKLSDEEDDEESDDGSNEWEVEEIVKHRIKKDENWEFLIRWKGCTAKDDTWETEENLNCSDLLLKYLAEVADTRGKDAPAKKKTSKQRVVGKKKRK